MSDKKTTSQQQTATTSTATTAPQVPDWLLDPAKNMASSLTALQGGGPAPFTPGESDLQKQAATGAGNLSLSPNYDAASGMITGAPQVHGASLLDGLDRYYNPFKDQVLNPVLNDYDVSSGRVRAAQSAREAATGSFRGSRAGVAEGQTEGELARGRSATEGGLLKDMYENATSLSNEDAGRRQAADTTNASNNLQGAGLLANIGQMTGADARANVGTQAALGDTETQLQNLIKQYPLAYQQQMEGLFQGLDPSLFTGQTINSNGTSNSSGTSKTSDPESFLADAAKIAAVVAMSDERVKTDIRTTHHDAKGRRWVDFSYVWDPATRHNGVIAQEIQKTDPDAVLPGPLGYLMVDYGRL